jgi:hypothetical protein
MTNSNPVWTEIEAGDSADANIIMDNFRVLQNSISDTTQSVSNKESISMKNAAGGYCGLDNNGKIPSERIGSDIITTILSSIYPVGSIYITESSSDTCPIASLIPGSTWEKIEKSRVLQQAGTWNNATYNPGTKVEAGLPNINGAFRIGDNNDGNYWGRCWATSGAFSGKAEKHIFGNYDDGSTETAIGNVKFHASDSSTIYGNSNTVQPPAYCVNIWRRTA